MGFPVRGNVDAEIQSPGGWRARLSGADTSAIVICLLIVACTVIVLWQLTEADKRREADKAVFVDLHRTTHRLLTGMHDNQLRTIETVKNSITSNEESAAAIVFMLGLNQQQREAMKIAMPPKLRHMMNNR